MIRLLCCLLTVTLMPAVAMLRTPPRTQGRSCPSCRYTPALRPTRMPIRPYSEGKKDSTTHSDDKAWEQYRAKADAKRLETWAKIEYDVAEEISEFKNKAKKHRALAAQHANYARAFETLADLKKDKLILFKLTLDKLNQAAVGFEYGEAPPSLDKEIALTKLLAETYEEFYNALPESEKV